MGRVVSYGAMFDADDDGVPEPLFYNGFRAGEDVGVDETGAPQARRLGIDTLAETGLQGRGVLINLFDGVGRERVAIGYDQF